MRILAALVALAATHVHVISGDTSIGGVHLARTNASGAAALFGAPAASRVSGQECVQRWPKLGLTLELGNAGLSPRPPCATGVALRMTITSRSAWRTSTGVRVGDTVARLRARYPHATHHADGWWLVRRRACATVGGFPYGSLRATVAGGKVASLVATTSVCD